MKILAQPKNEMMASNFPVFLKKNGRMIDWADSKLYLQPQNIKNNNFERTECKYQKELFKSYFEKDILVPQNQIDSVYKIVK